MKKIFYTVFILLIQFYLFANEIIKFNDIRPFIKNKSEEEIKKYIENIKNRRLETERGWVFSIENFDSKSDIVYVEMDKPNKNFELNKPDLFFIIDKKISRRLGEYQSLFFNATIKSYDISTGLIEITDIYLSGITR